MHNLLTYKAIKMMKRLHSATTQKYIERKRLRKVCPKETTEELRPNEALKAWET